MVAPGTVSPPAPAPGPLSPAVHRQGYGEVRFTVVDALAMVQQGILPEDATVELLDGSLVYRDRFDLKGGEIVEGLAHNFCLTLLSKLAARIDNDTRHVRTQRQLICSDTHAPIPDFLILRGPLSAYRDRLPTAADALCILEVADSSYDRDSTVKLTGYARAAIPRYIILNLRTRTAEVYTHPDPATGTYPPPRIFQSHELLTLAAGDSEIDVPLAELLP